MKRKLITLTLLCALAFSALGFRECSQAQTDQNLAFAKDVASSFRAAQKYVVVFKPELAKRFNEGIDIADKLISAVRSQDGTTAATLLRDLIPVFEEAAAAFAAAKGEKALAAFALADIGLHFLINHFPLGTATDAVTVAESGGKKSGVRIQAMKVEPDTANVILQFNEKQVWGCAYLPKKCQGDVQKVTP